MTDKRLQQSLLRQLPGVDHILELFKSEWEDSSVPKSLVVQSIQNVIVMKRSAILDGDPGITADSLSDQTIADAVKQEIDQAMRPRLNPLINATGVVVHTNLGRSPLSPTAMAHLSAIGKGYSNLEFDLSTGKRGSRYRVVEDILCEISGAESAMVVNNNAGAVLLSLETLARGKKVIVSRGELVEIGGAFRIPDVMTKSGCLLTEVGTTNRTHLKDYEAAIENETGLLLKVHTSNYSIVGFSAAVSVSELVALGDRYRIPVMEDLGSGTFVDFSRYGLEKEPTVQEAVASGADVITFSGDKLLGGPQAGIILGKKEIIDAVKNNPLNRALRIDKLTLAALEATLALYRDERRAVAEIPTLRMLTTDAGIIESRAERLSDILTKIDDSRLSVERLTGASKAGGGALPLMELPSQCVGIVIDGMSANTLDIRMRSHDPAIIGRIEDDTFVMDMRTVAEEDLEVIAAAVSDLLNQGI